MFRQHGAMLHVDQAVKSEEWKEEERNNKLFTMNIYDKLFWVGDNT